MFIHDLILRPRAPLMRLIRIVPRTKGLVRKGVNLCVAYLHSIIGDVRPPLPKSLNLMVTDVCNSSCKMCNVWTKKQEKELTPSELRNILCDPLFNKLNYVGVSGGEPTLREDFPELIKILHTNMPKAKFAMTTHGMNPDTEEKMFKTIGKFALWGLAAFGAFKAYEASPLKLQAGAQYSGQRALGTIEEARLWEVAGQPNNTRMG